MYDAIDCQGFAGGFTMGVVQAGFRLVGKRELPGGFGVASCEANRHLLGEDWVSEVSPEEEWTPYSVPLVFGNPPCSGFSLMSNKDFRGVDSPVNSCMWSLTHFAARCRPQFVVFESVQPAFKQGRPLMQALRLRLEELTGTRYELIHVLHNAANLGGCAIRKRYFFVCAAMPFGVDPIGLEPPNAIDAIGDLRGLGNTYELQPYRTPPTSYFAKSHETSDGLVDGHFSTVPVAVRRALDLMNGTHWHQGEIISDVARRHWETHGALPDSWADTLVTKFTASDFKMGFYQLHRWRGDIPARVVTGGAHTLTMHPTENRMLSIREVARVQGFPDDWLIAPLLRTQSVGKVGILWGKGIPVESGRWIAGNISRCLDGQPGTVRGDEIGERERLVDLTAVPGPRP